VSGPLGNPGASRGFDIPYWAKTIYMQIRKVIQRRIRRTSNGVDLVGDVNAAISANVGERGSTSHLSSHSSVSAQAGGRDHREDADDTRGERS